MHGALQVFTGRLDMLKGLISLLGTLAVIYFGLGAALFLFQRNQQYFPDGSIEIPRYLAARGVSLVEIEVEDGERLSAWYRPADKGMPTLLYFPGNGGSVADSHERFEEVLDSGFGFLALSYRGYPGSTGSPTEAGLFLDGITSYDWLIANGVPADRIVLYGWSLGSGVASKVASLRQAGALVLEAPFLSAESIARQRFPIFPIGFLMKDRYRTDRLLSQITQPLVVLHGTHDLTIPIDHGREIIRRYAGPKTLLEFPGGSHADLWDRGGWRKILDALRALIPR